MDTVFGSRRLTGVVARRAGFTPLAQQSSPDSRGVPPRTMIPKGKLVRAGDGAKSLLALTRRQSRGGRPTWTR